MFNKKIIIIVAAFVLIAVVAGGLFLFKDKDEKTLPIVYENTFPDTKVETRTEDFTNVSLPEVDNPGIPVTEEELAVTPEEEAEIKEIEAVQEVADVVKPPEKIVADNVVIKKAAEEAAANPDVQPVQMQPVEIEPAPEEPVTNADGFVYTKEQAVKIFTEKLLSFPDTDLNSPAAALAYAKLEAERAGTEFDQEAFDNDLNQLLTDPYSSPLLTVYLEKYRKTGYISTLIGFSSSWLSIGGDDGDWAERETR